MKYGLLLLVAVIANFATATPSDEIMGVPAKIYDFVKAHTYSREEARAIANKHRFQKLTPMQTANHEAA